MADDERIDAKARELYEVFLRSGADGAAGANRATPYDSLHEVAKAGWRRAARDLIALEATPEAKRLRFGKNVSKDPEVNAVAREIGNQIADALPDETGFVLLVFSFTSDFTAYFSNAQRPDAIKALRELADRMEGD